VKLKQWIFVFFLLNLIDLRVLNALPKTVWIKRSDGELSCAIEKAQSLKSGAKELKKFNIRIFNSKKTNDGQMHIQMCGAHTGSENSYLILAKDLAKAIDLGFREVGQKTIKK
jgi:hypothetical protein